MRQLSPAGRQTIDDIALRHGFGSDAVMCMLDAVINGNGSMAQFSHPEFSGSGQWMRGGMIMVSDMFNGHLKGRIDALCNELSNLVANQPDLVRSGSFQSQSQGGYSSGQQQNSYGDGGGGMHQPASGQFGGASLFVPPPAGMSADWWGADLRWPNSTGAQNGVRYAHFAQARRLAIEVNGHVTIYDTLDHHIGGFSQQQSYGGTLGFNSQYGLIDVGSLPVVSIDGQAVSGGNLAAAPQGHTQVFDAPFAPAASSSAGSDVFATIERLAELRAKGVLSDDEFSAKKAELLARL
jgi:Short C-terminal domain